MNGIPDIQIPLILSNSFGSPPSPAEGITAMSAAAADGTFAALG
jgi:hypothetical protein